MGRFLAVGRPALCLTASVGVWGRSLHGVGVGVGVCAASCLRIYPRPHCLVRRWAQANGMVVMVTQLHAAGDACEW